MNDDFANGFLQCIESGTPTWPPISLNGRERAKRGRSGGAARAQRRGEVDRGPELGVEVFALEALHGGSHGVPGLLKVSKVATGGR